MREIEAFQHRLFHATFAAMRRGMRRDETKRLEIKRGLEEELEKRKADLRFILGHELNPRSPIQMQSLFYGDLRCPVQRNRKTGEVSLNDDALKSIRQKNVLLRPLIQLIQEYRSIGVFIGTFVEAQLDADGRFRCSLNPCGTGTYRFSSSKNAFGSGGNMQNVPGHAHPEDDDYLELPNIRKLFIPDDGYTIFEIDLDRADLQVVVWEAEDEALKKVLRSGIDMHLYNMRDIYGIDIPDDEINEAHPECKEHKRRYYSQRHRAKTGVHAVDYFCFPRTLALALNCSVHEAETFRNRWFRAHPGIPAWHKRIEHSLQTRRRVENRFGYVWRVFDRLDGLLPEALAWIPQSTVGRVINEGWVRIFETLPQVEILLQVHDSLVGQFPTHLKEELLPKIQQLTEVTVPYDDPLVIPTGIKTSERSWGECH